MSARKFSVSEEALNAYRLDKFLDLQCQDLSRTRLKALIVDGHVQVNQNPLKDPNYRVKIGDVITFNVPQIETALPQPQNIPLDIVYEDDDLLVINKPAGLIVHPGAGNPDHTLVNALLYHYKGHLSGIGGVARPGIVHRLDKDTSGLLVVAKNDHAHTHLSNQLSDHSLGRIYEALVWGVPYPIEGTLESMIGRHPQNRQKMAIVERGGKNAITHYKTLETFKTFASHLECRLETGRTHQIRVHLSSIRTPIIGDLVYGKKTKLNPQPQFDKIREHLSHLKRHYLHAKQLHFIHPTKNIEVSFSCKTPKQMTEAISILRYL